ncbi:conserved hypothetical protein [Vibrio phage 249E41-1]|nr:conserved hypothetical protein [Vibrio phage 249E41-1]CAH9012057.1 conserved hypothetical protein [Vibrio phage 495E54-1]CAH9012137.1 conserved hypothetical protein [Vibrio phage 496E54-1]
MIKCKEDLLNTYIKTGDKELAKLYIEALAKYNLHKLDKVPVEHYLLERDHVSFSYISVSSGIVAQWWHEVHMENSRELTMKDFLLPKTKTAYEKVTESIFDLKEEFENGELYFKWFGNGEEGIGYDKIETENMLLCRYEEGRLLRKVEKPVSWQEQISEEYNFTYVEKENSFVQAGCTSSEDMIKFAKRVLELSGE